ncbi:MAG TPA: DUF3300 domain-containing protein [Steroidobacteraceae bacterium]|nr:DUF3300 domain-containing protein [Steroidobacteraceae bacterium]
MKAQARLTSGCGRKAAGAARPLAAGLMLVLTLAVTAAGGGWPAPSAAQAPPPPPPGAAPQGGPPGAGAPAYVQQSPEQLQQLVAPIALYPDSLVAQILAASTFPEQVVEADRWVQMNPGLKGAALGQAANAQPWDDSVKALTGFPDVLGNMDKNLSWTSSLGDAYYNQPQDVMAAVQVMRQRAQAAGNLKSTPQQVVTTQDSDISIEPANPDVVYVPAYDPWVVYGAPIYPWPGWYAYPGIWFAGPYLSFGIGWPIGFFAGFGWGWHHWGFDWRNHYVLYGRRPYFSRSTTFYNRGFYGRPGGGFGGARPLPGRPGEGRPGGARPDGARAPAGAERSANFGRPMSAERPFNSPDAAARPFNGSVAAMRGYSAPEGESGMRSDAFSGYNRGGDTRSFSSRGSASFGGGGGGGARGGGGGGARGGGGRR